MTRWSDDRIRTELAEFLTDADEWPNYREFVRAGRKTLRDQVTRAGGTERWARELGLRHVRRKPGYPPRWTEERVRRELRRLPRRPIGVADAPRVRGGRPQAASRRRESDRRPVAMGPGVRPPHPQPAIRLPPKGSRNKYEWDERGRDDKILCVACEDPSWSDIGGLEELPRQLRDEITHFFSIYRQPDGREVHVEGWLPRERALEVIDESRRRWAAAESPS